MRLCILCYSRCSGSVSNERRTVVMRLYHGSDIEIVAVDLSRSQVNKDFGKGFYLSDDLSGMMLIKDIILSKHCRCHILWELLPYSLYRTPTV